MRNIVPSFYDLDEVKWKVGARYSETERKVTEKLTLSAGALKPTLYSLLFQSLRP